MNFFYILSGPLGYVMEWIYKLLPNYGWDIILFTLLINIVKIPLQTSQQKSMAKMSAFQPMIAEIQTKYKNKPEKQQEELMKLQQDFGYKPTAGCMPMLLNFLVMFGVIGVVYNPLERIFHISAAALASAGEAMTAAGISFTAITRDTNIIAEVVAGNSGVLGCFTAQQIATITEFSQHMNFFGIDLTRIPKLGLSLDIVLPLLSVITMFLSTHISMKASGQQMQGSMKLTMYMMPLMLYLPAGILSVLRHFQHRHDRTDSGHAQVLRPREDAQGSGSGDRRQAQAGKARCEEHHHHGDRPQDRQERGKEPFRQRDEQAPAGVCPSAGRRALQGRAHRAAERA